MNLCYDINYKITQFLDNQSIFNMNTVNKDFNRFYKNPYIFEYVKYRNHPMVFNLIDNYCNICNVGIIFFDINHNITFCTHI